MAKYQMCSVLDMVAQQYGRPFFTVSDGTAIRSFADEILKGGPDSTLSTHPDDFQLFLIGTFDDDSCQIDLLASPQLLISGAAIAQRAARNGAAIAAEPAVGVEVKNHG